MNGVPAWWVAVMCAAAGACTSEARPLRFGTTYTVEQSGALALLEPRGIAAGSPAPPPVTVVVAPSGQILRSAARGDLDVVVTHAPSLEERILVGPGHARLRCPFVASRFAIVGPPADPAAVATAPGAVAAFAAIARAGALFVSRGDSSGTHVTELALWAAAGVRPQGERWYLESGADQAAALRLADERGAYALADLPTLARLPPLDLRVLLWRDSALVNRYTLYVVASERPHTAADSFARWALDTWRPRVLAIRLPDGQPAFEPSPDAPGCRPGSDTVFQEVH